MKRAFPSTLRFIFLIWSSCCGDMDLSTVTNGSLEKSQNEIDKSRRDDFCSMKEIIQYYSKFSEEVHKNEKKNCFKSLFKF